MYGGRGEGLGDFSPDNTSNVVARWLGYIGIVSMSAKTPKSNRVVYLYSFARHAVIAFDHGAPSQISAVNLTIEVDDVNDNAPFCIEPITTVRIPEDYPDGALVGCVAATDPDIGPNARLRFSLEPEENGLAPPFKIDHRTGCVFIHSPHQPLDFQRRSVADNGEVVLSTTCSYVVELEDVDENLHPPEFDDVALEASVYDILVIERTVYLPYLSNRATL
ncbi:unnamed protein product [Cylicostephanus goldi]|uniref:Cadherin domain-containing protein n=1 Tax=Cylicostephanus goldi TaxID=71465 RepID=A0A3P7PT05_CYLGO|nr:unnamed protein product [Cylicostephanus goldi]